MSGTIIVGINESAPSRAATTWALNRGTITQEDVSLTHVLAVDDSLNENVAASASMRLIVHAADARRAAPQVVVSTELRVGDTLSQLVVASADASLLVMGTHKTGFVQGRVFGSRYIQLAASAHCPVIFVPSGSGRNAQAGVVVGVKNAELDRAALAFAAREAASTDSKLSIVHCWTLADIADETVAAQARRSMIQSLGADRILAEAEAIVNETECGLAIRSRSIRRATAEGLIDASASALLLVLGRSRTESAIGRVLGHTVHDVLLNLTVPTAIVATDALPSLPR